MIFKLTTIIVPVYNGGKTIPILFKRIKETFEKQHFDFELIFVEDCGQDNSWDVIKSLAIDDPRIRGIKLARNYGQHNALLCGIREANGDIIVTLDDDLQNPPEEIPKLIEKLEKGYDVVYGTPINRTHGFFRDTASALTKKSLSLFLGANIAQDVSAFRVFRTKLRNAFDQYRSPMISIDVLLTWATTSFASVKVRQEERPVGSSGYTFRKLVKLSFNMITGFSTLPLKIASLLGICLSLFGAGIFAYVLLRFFIHGSPVPGFAFLASIISIFSGAQLLVLGIIGEYLSRIYFRTMDQPPYVVKHKIGNYFADTDMNSPNTEV
jgi:glycosyltransferase involved in cell wall biosynthesis